MKRPRIYIIASLSVIIAAMCGCQSVSPSRQAHIEYPLGTKPIKVNVENYVRAESDTQIQKYAKTLGCFGKMVHQRDFYSVDKQLTPRVNRDTYYSFGLYDLTTPVTITKPDPGDRFQSLMTINQYHSIFPTVHEGGTFTFTKEKVGSRYLIVMIRTFADPTSPEDQKIAHEMQDTIKVEQADPGKLELPNLDEESRQEMMDAINVLAGSLPTTEGFFGEIGKIDPIKHLMGTAYGYAGNPREAAIYLNIVPEKNDGKTPYRVTVRDVPVDGFWSITMYDAGGYMVKNNYNAYSVNGKSAKKNADGSITVHFGGDPKNTNYLPTPKGWNTIIRLYQPGKELLEGGWEFPQFELTK
jgi:hypothetical protein